MRIGERFYEGYELRLDHDDAAPSEASFLTDLENIRIGTTPVELTPMPVLVPGTGPVAVPTETPTPAPARPVALTPLELAVHELLAQLPAEAGQVELPDAPGSDDTDKLDETTVQPEDALAADLPAPHVASEPVKHAAHAPAGKPTAVVAVQDPAPLPENPNPSHVHLVLEEGGERIVATVAVRGNEVNVMLRASDDEVAAALARNAATLDHAMRARGLDLADFTTQRDHTHDSHERDHDHEPSHEEESP